jgi:hypothetical protein
MIRLSSPPRTTLASYRLSSRRYERWDVIVADKEVDPNDQGVQGELHQDRFVAERDLTRWDNRAGRSLVSAVQWMSQKLGPHGALILTLAAGP